MNNQNGDPVSIGPSQSTNSLAAGQIGWSDRSTSFKLSRERQYLFTAIPILIVDILTFLICFAFATTINSSFFVTTPIEYKWIGIILCVHMVACFMIMELYDGVGMHPVYEFRQSTLCLSLLFILVTSHLIFSGNYAAIAAVICFPMMIIGIPIARSIARSILSNCPWWGIRALVFSAGRRVGRLYRAHLDNTSMGVRPLGFMQADVPEKLDDEIKAHYLGDISQAAQFSEQLDAYCAVVHRYGRTDRQIFDFVEEKLSNFSRVLVHPDDPRLPSL